MSQYDIVNINRFEDIDFKTKLSYNEKKEFFAKELDDILTKVNVMFKTDYDDTQICKYIEFYKKLGLLIIKIVISHTDVCICMNDEIKSIINFIEGAKNLIDSLIRMKGIEMKYKLDIIEDCDAMELLVDEITDLQIEEYVFNKCNKLIDSINNLFDKDSSVNINVILILYAKISDVQIGYASQNMLKCKCIMNEDKFFINLFDNINKLKKFIDTQILMLKNEKIKTELYKISELIKCNQCHTDDIFYTTHTYFESVIEFNLDESFKRIHNKIFTDIPDSVDV